MITDSDLGEGRRGAPNRSHGSHCSLLESESVESVTATSLASWDDDDDVG